MSEIIEMKPYTFRKLTAVDIAPMCRIISKIGINEFGKCFESESVKKLINKGVNDSAKNKAVGFQVIIEIANVVISHIPDCENEIFALLASVTDLDIDSIKTFDLAEFTQMLIDFVQKEEFKDFFGVVSKLLKQTT